MRPAGRNRFLGIHRQRGIERAATARKTRRLARAAASSRPEAIQALVKALAAEHPGQPVTVTFNDDNSPAAAVHVTIDLPRRQGQQAEPAATGNEPVSPEGSAADATVPGSATSRAAGAVGRQLHAVQVSRASPSR